MTTADRIAAEIGTAGVHRVYGLPGEDHLELLEAFHRKGIAYVPAVNETSAAIMAATDAEASRTAGVCLLSMAPGVSNAVNGILHAHMEQLPLLVVSGQRSPEALPMLVRQGFDFERLLQPMVKWSVRVAANSDVRPLLRKAIHLATSGTPGPVYVEVPSSAAAVEGSDGGPVPPVANWNPPPAAAGPHGPSELAERLGDARRPVLVVGGRTPPDATEAITRFAALRRCPVFTTPKRTGMFAVDVAFDCGTFLNGNLERRLIGQSDLLLMIDPVAFDYYNRPWHHDVLPDLICSSSDHVEYRLPFRSAVVGSVPGILDDLDSGTGPTRSEWTADDVVSYRQSVRETLLDPPGFTVARAVDAALAGRPPEADLVADAGFTKPLALMLQELKVPARFFGSNALSTMGYAIPAAMALSRAERGPALAFVGDGSLLMRATELALHEGLRHPIALVASMDTALTQIRVKQHRQELGGIGTALPDLSCADLGKALGVPGIDVASATELTKAVEGVWDGRPLPHLIGAHVDAGSSQEMYEILRG